MSDDQRREMAKKTAVYQLAGMERVRVTENLEYRRGLTGALKMDLYAPEAATLDERLPLVVFVLGFPQPMLSKGMKDTGAYTSWGRLVAASGMMAATYTYDNPVADLRALLQYITARAADLGVDADKIGVWSCSGNSPVALSFLMEARPEVRCAAFCYSCLLDLGGATHVSHMASQLGFSNPSAGKTPADLPASLPLFLARAGRDQIPHLNQTLDRFVAAALQQNLPLTLTNHPTGPHAFDLLDDSETSRVIIRDLLSFLRRHLLGAV